MALLDDWKQRAKKICKKSFVDFYGQNSNATHFQLLSTVIDPKKNPTPDLNDSEKLAWRPGDAGMIELILNLRE
jgi:hypothetical protein